MSVDSLSVGEFKLVNHCFDAKEVLIVIALDPHQSDLRLLSYITASVASVGISLLCSRTGLWFIQFNSDTQRLTLVLLLLWERELGRGRVTFASTLLEISSRARSQFIYCLNITSL